jgi:hypothetical protein
MSGKAKPRTGKFTIRVHKAQKLYDTHTFGKQDPFVEVDLGDFKKATKTHTDGGREPVWEEEFTTQLTGFELKLGIVVKHKGAVTNDLIGSADVPMSQFLCGDLAPTWYRLGREGKGHVFAGEIMISSKFVDDNKDQENKEKAAQDLITRLQQKIQFLESSIAQKEADIAEEEINHSNQRDALKREIAELKEKNAKLEAAASKVASMENKISKMIPDPVDEDYYENQRYMPLKGWQAPYLPTDRHQYTNQKGTEERTKAMVQLPANWKWVDSDWTVDTTRVGVDKDGWEYAKDFSTEWHSSNTKLDSVRRRRWHRKRDYVVPT